MTELWYMALTYVGETKENPHGVARCNKGVFERYNKGTGWVEDKSLYAILVGQYDNYTEITEDEAKSLIEKQFN